MKSKMPNNKGLKLLVKRCREDFQRIENTEYYDHDDFQAAERKYVKHCLFSEPGSIY